MANQTGGAVGVLRFFVLDVNDLDGAASFWSGVLGASPEPGTSPQYIHISQPGGPMLFLQAVPEHKTVKNRAHVDIEVADVDAAVAQVEALGGRMLRIVEDPGDRFAVMADPDSNEFCLVT